MNNRLQQLADIINKIYQVTEKLAIEMELHLEATKVDTQAIYSFISPYTLKIILDKSIDVNIFIIFILIKINRILT